MPTEFANVFAICPPAGWEVCRPLPVASKDGSWRWFDAEARDHTNLPAIEGIVVIFGTFTDLHRMEAERQVISEIVHALNETANLDELLRGIQSAMEESSYGRMLRRAP